ncbi:AraC-like DNA-binding protein [Roseiarcus fermentans]|uniref:AraC-like DNA-binding protein n=1 Tax=Roseiarcus fermentans TaxID=1473586 RepID=A0A366FSM8_9HYPH|nr:AraC-like DNA-binding protein [Roseiarcus fermentans]
MEPDLEVIQIRPSESFSAMCHGYPYRTVRWHFHPEFEIHQIVTTRGRYFVGDFIGEFEPGNLVLTGPNLPHNWISDVPAGQAVDLRCRFIQFTSDFIAAATKAFPELKAIAPLLESARRGVVFSSQTSHEVRPILEAIMEAQGVLRIELFMKIMGLLSRERSARVLASESYVPDPSGYMTAGMNKALAYIRENLTQPFQERDLAAIAKQSTGAFSRSFRKHTGMSLLQYIRRLRINMACQILMSDEHAQVSDICFEVGFNNLSNFNRQFLAEKGMPPSQFRKRLADNVSAAEPHGREDQQRATHCPHGDNKTDAHGRRPSGDAVDPRSSGELRNRGRSDGGTAPALHHVRRREPRRTVDQLSPTTT